MDNRGGLSWWVVEEDHIMVDDLWERRSLMKNLWLMLFSVLIVCWSSCSPSLSWSTSSKVNVDKFSFVVA